MLVLAIVAAALLIIVVTVLLMPVVAHIKYSDTFELRLSYAGITIPLEGKKTKKKKKKKKPDGKSKKPDKKSKSKISLDDIIAIIQIGIKAVERLLKSIKIRRFKLAVVVSGEDAATAAINYGRVCALASATYPIIENSLDKKHTDISVDLQYDSKTTANADIIIKAMTLKLVIIVLKALIAVLPVINNKNKKGGATNERSK